jgi:hypothetical protein
MTDTNGSRGERLQVMLLGVELDALDDFRFVQRMPTRAAAVRELLKRGLAAEGYLKNGGRTKSSDFGVLTAAQAKPQIDAARAKRK